MLAPRHRTVYPYRHWQTWIGVAACGLCAYTGSRLGGLAGAALGGLIGGMLLTLATNYVRRRYYGGDQTSR